MALSPVLTAPVSTVLALFALGAAGGGFDGTERAGMRSDGGKQGRNSADGCDEDRALLVPLPDRLAPAGSVPGGTGDWWQNSNNNSADNKAADGY